MQARRQRRRVIGRNENRDDIERSIGRPCGLTLYVGLMSAAEKPARCVVIMFVTPLFVTPLGVSTIPGRAESSRIPASDSGSAP